MHEQGKKFAYRFKKCLIEKEQLDLIYPIKNKIMYLIFPNQHIYLNDCYFGHLLVRIDKDMKTFFRNIFMRASAIAKGSQYTRSISIRNTTREELIFPRTLL